MQEGIMYLVSEGKGIGIKRSAGRVQKYDLLLGVKNTENNRRAVSRTLNALGYKVEVGAGCSK